MDFSIAVAFFAIASTGTPGPNNMMILASGLNFGVYRSIPHWLGIITGVPMMIITLGLGLEQLFVHYPISFLIIKIIGSSYLLYMAYKITQLKVDGTEQHTRSRPFTFVQAFFFQWVNPKAWVMSIGAIATFTQAADPLLPQIISIAITFNVMGAVCVGLWLTTGQLLQRLIKNETHQRRFNRTMGALLALSVLPMVL